MKLSTSLSIVPKRFIAEKQHWKEGGFFEGSAEF